MFYFCHFLGFPLKLLALSPLLVGKLFFFETLFVKGSEPLWHISNFPKTLTI